MGCTIKTSCRSLTAEGARKLAEGSEWLIEHILDDISDAALKNGSRVRFDVKDTLDSVKNGVVDELKGLGYTVLKYRAGGIESDDAYWFDSISVSWDNK